MRARSDSRVDEEQQPHTAQIDSLERQTDSYSCTESDRAHCNPPGALTRRVASSSMAPATRSDPAPVVPRDARLVALILAAAGAEDCEEGVVRMLVEFAHRECCSLSPACSRRSIETTRASWSGTAH